MGHGTSPMCLAGDIASSRPSTASGTGPAPRRRHGVAAKRRRRATARARADGRAGGDGGRALLSPRRAPLRQYRRPRRHGEDDGGHCNGPCPPRAVRRRDRLRRPGRAHRSGARSGNAGHRPGPGDAGPGPHAGPPGPSRRPARPGRAGQLRARDRGGSRSGRADLRRSTARVPAGHQPGGAARRGRDPASAAAAGDAGRDGGADGGPGPRFAGRRAVHAARARQRAWRRAHGSGCADGGRDLPAARRDRARYRAGGQPGRSLRPGGHGGSPEQPLQAAMAGAAQRSAPAPDAACNAGLELQPPLRARPPRA